MTMHIPYARHEPVVQDVEGKCLCGLKVALTHDTFRFQAILTHV